MVKWYVIKNGEKVIKRGRTYPNGYYEKFLGEEEVTLINPNYEGFRMVFKSGAQPKIIGRCETGYISDNVDFVSHHDGKYYSSKHKYYAELKASGNHVTEAGEIGSNRDLQGDYNVRKELKQALQQHLGS